MNRRCRRWAFAVVSIFSVGVFVWGIIRTLRRIDDATRAAMPVSLPVPQRVPVPQEGAPSQEEKRHEDEAGEWLVEAGPVPFDNPVSISGRVVNEAGEPVGDATVEVDLSFMTDFDRARVPNPEVTTDSQGRFRIEGLRRGDDYLVGARHPEYALGFDPAVPTPWEGNPSDVELKLGTGFKIHGRVLTPAGEPIPGALVVPGGPRHYCLLPGVESEIVVLEKKQTTSGGDGSFAIEHLANENYTLHVSKEGLSSENVGVDARDGERYEIFLTPYAAAPDTSEKKPPTATISGTIWAGGKDVTMTTEVSAAGNDGWKYEQLDFDRDKGVFVLHVAPGIHTLHAEVPGFVPARLANITVTAGAHHGGVKLTLAPEAVVRGRVSFSGHLDYFTPVVRLKPVINLGVEFRSNIADDGSFEIRGRKSRFSTTRGTTSLTTSLWATITVRAVTTGSSPPKRASPSPTPSPRGPTGCVRQRANGARRLLKRRWT